MSKPKRIQQRRTKGWRKPEGAVAVGRPSKWGNPWRVRRAYNDGQWDIIETVPDLGDTSVEWAGSLADARAQAVEIFRAILFDGASAEKPEYPSADEIRAELAGKDLMCWCPLDQPCHADVLLELANPKEQL